MWVIKSYLPRTQVVKFDDNVSHQLSVKIDTGEDTIWLHYCLFFTLT